MPTLDIAPDDITLSLGFRWSVVFTEHRSVPVPSR